MKLYFYLKDRGIPVNSTRDFDILTTKETYFHSMLMYNYHMNRANIQRKFFSAYQNEFNLAMAAKQKAINAEMELHDMGVTFQ